MIWFYFLGWGRFFRNFSNLCTLFRKIYISDFVENFVRAQANLVVWLRKVLWSYVAPQKFIHYAATLITPFLRPQNIDFLGVKVQFFDIFPNCTYNYQRSTEPIILKNCLELVVCLFEVWQKLYVHVLLNSR